MQRRDLKPDGNVRNDSDDRRGVARFPATVSGKSAACRIRTAVSTARSADLHSHFRTAGNCGKHANSRYLWGMLRVRLVDFIPCELATLADLFLSFFFFFLKRVTRRQIYRGYYFRCLYTEFHEKLNTG